VTGAVAKGRPALKPEPRMRQAESPGRLDSIINANYSHSIMTEKAPEPAQSPAPGIVSPAALRHPPARIPSAALFGGHREVLIEHGEREYRLRITLSGKLILTA